MFSAVFPFAPILSYCCNYIQQKTQVHNMIYYRRVKPEVSYGIGNWLTTLEIICQLAIFMNAGIMYFTSSTMPGMFYGVNYERLVKRVQNQLKTSPNVEGKVLEDLKIAGHEATSKALEFAEIHNVTILTPQWDALQFMVFIIVVEHCLLALKLVIQLAVKDTPDDVVERTRIKDTIQTQFLRNGFEAKKYKDGDNM